MTLVIQHLQYKCVSSKVNNQTDEIEGVKQTSEDIIITQLQPKNHLHFGVHSIID